VAVFTRVGIVVVNVPEVSDAVLIGIPAPLIVTVPEALKPLPVAVTDCPTVTMFGLMPSEAVPPTALPLTTKVAELVCDESHAVTV